MFQHFDHLNISERPSSAPAGPGGSSLKRRRVANADARSLLGRPAADDDRLRHLKEKIKEQERHWVEMERLVKAREEELKAFQEKQDAEVRQWDKEAKATQAKMHQEIMQLLYAQLSTKKDSVVAPVVGSTLIVETEFVAIVAPDVLLSVEVEPIVDLHMCKVSESSLHQPARSLAPLPRSPSHSLSQGISSKSSSSFAPT